MRILKFLVKASLIFILIQVVVISLALVALQSGLLKNVPVIGGHQALVVLSGSMEPSFHVGSVVVIEKVDPNLVREGDVITFNTPLDLNHKQPAEKTMTTHRVERIIDNQGVRLFETKGDANNDVDANTVMATDVVGRATFDVPYLGYASHFLRGKTGLMVLIAVAVGVILFELGHLALKLRGRRYSGSY